MTPIEETIAKVKKQKDRMAEKWYGKEETIRLKYFGHKFSI